MSHHLTPADPALFTDIVSRCEDRFQEDGFHILRLESQEWPVHLALTGPSVDGTIEVFYGTPVRQENGPWHIRYHVTREEERHGVLEFAPDATPEAISTGLCNRISEIVRELLHIGAHHDPNVGVGLRPPNQPSAE